MKLHPYGMIYTVLYIILCKLFLETFAKKRSVSIFYTTMLLGVLSVLEYVCSVVLADFLVLKAILIIVMGTFVMMYVFGEKFWRILILMLLKRVRLTFLMHLGILDALFYRLLQNANLLIKYTAKVHMQATSRKKALTP